MSLSSQFQPLYKQVYDLLVKRIASAEWKPGTALPSEFALADELGVSQGTVRKALNQLVTEKLLDRQQGRGTFVAQHTDESSLYRFFRFREPAGEMIIPETQLLNVSRRSCTKLEAGKLNLNKGDLVAQMERVRSINGKPTIFEIVVQPLSVFPGIDKLDEIPNALYSLYQQHYGVSIASVKEELEAISATKKVAKRIGVAEGDPVLKVCRTSVSIDEKHVEYSTAVSSTDNFVYSVSLN